MTNDHKLVNPIKPHDSIPVPSLTSEPATDKPRSQYQVHRAVVLILNHVRAYKYGYSSNRLRVLRLGLCLSK